MGAQLLESTSRSTWPPSTACSASAPPLKGMWFMRMPAAIRNSSQPTWVAAHAGAGKGDLAGPRLASATSSCRVFQGAVGSTAVPKA